MKHRTLNMRLSIFLRRATATALLCDALKKQVESVQITILVLVCSILNRVLYGSHMPNEVEI